MRRQTQTGGNHARNGAAEAGVVGCAGRCVVRQRGGGDRPGEESSGGGPGRDTVCLGGQTRGGETGAPTELARGLTESVRPESRGRKRPGFPGLTPTRFRRYVASLNVAPGRGFGIAPGGLTRRPVARPDNRIGTMFFRRVRSGSQGAKWRTEASRSSPGRPSMQAAQPTRSGRGPKSANTLPSRLGPG